MNTGLRDFDAEHIVEFDSFVYFRCFVDTRLSQILAFKNARKRFADVSAQFFRDGE